MDSNSLIDGTTLTLKLILEMLERKHEYYQKLINYGKSVTSFTVKNISTGFGHGSIVYKLSLHFTSKNIPSESETLSVALKIPSCEIFYQQRLKVNPNIPKNIKEQISERVAKVHKNECFFYTKISPFLKNLKLPKIYATKEWNFAEKEEGYILMEDLSAVGIVLSKYDFVLEDRVKAVVKEIVKMQAEWIKESVKIDWKEMGKESNETKLERFTNSFLSFVPAFIELVDDNEKVKGDLNKIMVLVGNKDYHVWVYETVYKELGLPSMLVHGDLWNSNIFNKKNSETEILAFIDWQMVYEGSPASDLARYLLLNTEGPIRRQIESTIFSFYIQYLRDEIPNLNISESQIRKAYNYSLISEFIGLLMITVNNAKLLQNLINENKNVQENLTIKNKIISQVIFAMEDIAKLIETEMAEVVEQFRKM